MPDKPVKREYWIQIEGGEGITWNMTPNRWDRMHGREIGDTIVKNVLILRRYLPPDLGGGEWKTPDDRKINPWDLNEKDPYETGGTIPGPTIECNVGVPGVGEDIIVHFRNADNRNVPRAYKIHSLHPHGITFPTRYGGAYPLSPPDIRDPGIPNFDEDDPNNEITDDEREAWKAIGVEGDYKQGDRVPPCGTFTYRWRTFGWPSTAGVWFYHDHSVKDVENVRAGAIGILVIHNPDDPDDVFIDWDNPYDDDTVHTEAISNLPDEKPDGEITQVEVTIDQDGNKIKKKRLRKPPGKALYLQLYHELVEIDEEGRVNMTCMAINGRKFLGNTPTLVGGYGTKMRFGLVAMNQHAFHTFHLHGHRWIIPGPKGDNREKIQKSPQIEAASQFEDTRIFGPGNSFSFTIKQGSFMGPLQGHAVGEWYMHCHVLHHMMPGGMIGSLLIIGNDEPEVDKKLLPEGHIFHI